MLEPKTKRDLSKRLHILQGQLRAIEQMLNEAHDPRDVFIQMKAVERGMHTAIHDVLEDNLKHQLAERLSTRLASCPGNCGDAERLQMIRREFAQFDLKDVIVSLEWLTPSSH